MLCEIHLFKLIFLLIFHSPVYYDLAVGGSITLTEPEVFPANNPLYGGYLNRVEYRFTSPPGTNLFFQLQNFSASSNTPWSAYSGLFVAAGHDVPVFEEYRLEHYPLLPYFSSISDTFITSILSDEGIVVILQPWNDDVNVTFTMSAYEGKLHCRRFIGICLGTV